MSKEFRSCLKPEDRTNIGLALELLGDEAARGGGRSSEPHAKVARGEKIHPDSATKSHGQQIAAAHKPFA